MIIKYLKEIHPSLRHVRCVSDGCTAQFKNKYTLSNLLHTEIDFNVTAEWFFSPTSHGKTGADGLGGTFKRLVTNRILTGLHEVHDAQGFFDCAQTFAKSTKLFCVSQSDVETFYPMLHERWSKVKNIPGTRDFHYFKPLYEENKILAAITARNDGAKIFKM